MHQFRQIYKSFIALPEKYVVLLFFAVIYCLLSLVNHYLFRTYSLDLGLYTNALYDYSHFQWNDSTVFKTEPQNLMGDHFDFYLMAFSPLVWLFGSYTLLIVQIASILVGGLGVYRYFKSNRFIAFCAMTFFYSFFGVFTALSFDFHDSVVVAMLVPWLFVFTKERRMKAAGILIVVLWLGKENSALWITFICFGLSLLNWKEQKWRIFFILSGCASFVYFFIVIKFIMPALAPDGVYPHFDYPDIGNNMSEAISFLFTHPIKSFNLMVSNFNKDPMATTTKADLMYYLLFAGLGLLIFRPAYLLMLIPVFFQKLFHNSPLIWGAGLHYCVEFMPILAIGIFEVLVKIKKGYLKKGIAMVVLSSTIITAYQRLSEPYFYASQANLNFVEKEHYQKNYSVHKVYAALDKIPSDAKVSAQSNLVPHVANRDVCYTYPILNDAEYVVLSKKDTPYPLNDSIYSLEIIRFQKSDQWIKLVDNSDVLLVKKR